MDYRGYEVKVPIESDNYYEMSKNVITAINSMLNDAFEHDNKTININTNIRGKFPIDNVNKIAAPLIEAWAAEVFENVYTNDNNKYHLINVEVGTNRTDLADVILQFKDDTNYSTGNIDVKSTTDTIKKSGKSPNITSFAKIRTAYIKDPDFIFIILSIKYHPYATKSKDGNAQCIINLNKFDTYDFKYLSDKDFNINPSLGTGQIQIRDIHYVSTRVRSAKEFVELLDDKYIKGKGHTFESWLKEAKTYKWIK